MAFLAGAILVIGMSTPLAYAKATSFTETERFPLDIELFVPCAAGGAGEDVHLTGEVQTLLHVTRNDAGSVHFQIHANLQGFSGTGLTTGDKYQSTAVEQFKVNSKVGFETTVMDNFRIIGQGNGNNFLLHDLIHVTFNPDGTLTSFVDNFNVECK